MVCVSMRRVLTTAVWLLAAFALWACEPVAEMSTSDASPSAGNLTPEPVPTSTPRPTSTTTPHPTSTPTPRPLADFGDAPDGVAAGYANPRVVGRFPTRLSSLSAVGPGAHVRQPGPDRLGTRVSSESDADDQDDPDGVTNLVNNDAGDDGVKSLTVSLMPPDSLATLEIEVSLEAGVQTGPRYLNVLIDIDRDGRWSGSVAGLSEWVLRNWVVELDPGTSQTFVSRPFAMLDGRVLPDGAWMRVVLMREPLQDATWDGSGAWEFGEVEDYQVVLPEVIRGDGSRPALTVVDCPDVLDWMASVLVLGGVCTATNIGEDGDFGARIVRASGSVTLIPDTVKSEILRVGATRTISLAMVRADVATRWRLRSTTASVAGRIKSGVVVMGIDSHEVFINAVLDDSAERMFELDAQEDYFNIINLSPVDGFGFADIQRVALGLADIEGVGLDVLRRAYFAVEQPGARVAGDYLVAVIEMVDPIPLAEPSLGMRVSVALVANDDIEDDWRPQVRDFDLYQGTDHWYELIYTPGLEPAWLVQRRVSLAPSLALRTDAIAYIDGRRVLMFLPRAELEREPNDLKYRVMTFVHEPGDPTGTERPSMADVFPPLDQSLQPFGRIPLPFG